MLLNVYAAEASSLLVGMAPARSIVPDLNEHEHGDSHDQQADAAFQNLFHQARFRSRNQIQAPLPSSGMTAWRLLISRVL
jgi:hypothetical protein